MKRFLTLMLISWGYTAISLAQKENNWPQWVQDIKLSGYGMFQFQANDKGKDENTFNVKLIRLSLEGKVLEDFYWKIQMQVNGNTSSLGTSPRLVDYFGEWRKYKAFSLKVGQFKRPFTFENPMHPITQGFMSYAQAVTKLSGFNDRTGEHASNGRDIGVQVQGDFLKNKNGRELMHYQLGVFNGEGINRTDADNRKDIIGGLWVMPVEGLRIGVFGWTGSRVIEDKSVEKNRYALSAEYVKDDWTLRSEYIHSQGFGEHFDDGDKADGFYALCIAPVIKDKFHVKARYDVYRNRKEWDSARTLYEIGADYQWNKNLILNFEYARVNDKNLTKHNYNLIDLELDIKF